jgi:WD40 repeat protein
MPCTANPAHSGYLAVNYCFQCQQFLCSLCKTIHNTLNKTHIISDEEIKIDKICDRHLVQNEIVSHCLECNMNLCETCLKEHNIHHDIYDLKTCFPRNLSDKYYEDFKLIHVTFFKYINEAKKIIDEKILEEKNKLEQNEENEKRIELKNAVKNMDGIFKKNNDMNQDLIKLISLMFENYYNTIESTPNFNIIYQLKILTRFNNNLKPFKYDENLTVIENITSFINYLNKIYIIKTINTPLEIKDITKIPQLKNTRILVYLGGNKLASGNMESDIQIFDINTKNVVKHIVGHFFSVSAMCYVDNKYIISGGRDTAMNIYDPSIFIDDDEGNDDMRENCYRGFLLGHDDTICKIIQFKDGKVATCGFDKRINIFGKCLSNQAKEDFPVIELTEEEKEKIEKEKEKANKEIEDKRYISNNRKKKNKKKNKKIKFLYGDNQNKNNQNNNSKSNDDNSIFCFENVEIIGNKKIFELLVVFNVIMILIILCLIGSIYSIKSNIEYEKVLEEEFMNKLSYLNVINDYNDDDYGQRSGIGDWDQSDFLFENEQQKTYFKEEIISRENSKIKDIDFILKYKSSRDGKNFETFFNYCKGIEDSLLLIRNDRAQKFALLSKNIVEVLRGNKMKDFQGIKKNFVMYNFNRHDIFEYNFTRNFEEIYSAFIKTIFGFFTDKGDFEDRLHFLGRIVEIEIYELKYIK